ncbi:MAG: Cobalamin-5-phosphate synthase [uncultured Acidilobus sp. CIS]|nr:MAG: Cobalamin-5-phosphate synthase [uncultured Acidilobus sp. CIS]
MGLLEGAIVAAVGFPLRQRSLLAAAVMLIAHVLLTGAMHLDGSSDYGDVLGSRAKGKEALRVLKDPRRGAFGVVTAAVLIVARFSAFYYLAGRPVLVVASYVTGLESAYITSFLGYEEPYDGMARLITAEAKRPRKLLLNLTITALCLAPLALLNVVSLLGLVGLAAAFVIAHDANRRLGFVNGDVLGFSIEASEVTSLLVMAGWA